MVVRRFTVILCTLHPVMLVLAVVVRYTSAVLTCYQRLLLLMLLSWLLLRVRRYRSHMCHSNSCLKVPDQVQEEQIKSNIMCVYQCDPFARTCSFYPSSPPLLSDSHPPPLLSTSFAHDVSLLPDAAAALFLRDSPHPTVTSLHDMQPYDNPFIIVYLVRSMNSAAITTHTSRLLHRICSAATAHVTSMPHARAAQVS